MQNSNLQVIQQMYHDFGRGDMPAVLAAFSKDVIWTRTGAPFIPFSGTFNGMDEVMKMFALQEENLEMTSFVPRQFTTSDNMVVVIGHDEAVAKPTGKSYSADWVQAFTLAEGKISAVQVFMDTKAIADAFEK